MAKNQIHALIDMLRDTMVAHNVHDAIAAAALLSLPVLVVLWITNRMRHPERSFPWDSMCGRLDGRMAADCRGSPSSQGPLIGR